MIETQRTENWHVTRKGYLRGKIGGRQRMAHVVAWESVYGPVPAGKQIHHINEEKTDNRIENLEALTPLEHKRKHSGCELRGGVWWKPCGMCRAMKPIDVEHWYLSREGWPLYGRCRRCHCKKVCDDARRKTEERQARRPPKKAAPPQPPRPPTKGDRIVAALVECPGIRVPDIALKVYGASDAARVTRTHRMLHRLRRHSRVSRIGFGQWRARPPEEPRPERERVQRVKPADPRQVALFSGGGQ